MTSIATLIAVIFIILYILENRAKNKVANTAYLKINDLGASLKKVMDVHEKYKARIKKEVKFSDIQKEYFFETSEQVIDGYRSTQTKKTLKAFLSNVKEQYIKNANK